jgi:hypothetical protein
MQEIINKIIQQNASLFGENPIIQKINIGFTNTIYNVNDSYIIKICTNFDNESEFQKEIDFYNSNKNNELIPKLYYSSTDKAFKSTTISEDNCIQEVPDERAIAKAESKYTQDMADLESKDKRFDLELKKLDTEHKALDTEYESVKNVIDKNVESSFKIFS